MRNHKILTLPNLLSMFRLLLIPVIIWLYTVKQNTSWTLAVLTLSGITDIADGIIARRFHMVSDFGKALDPVADKLTQLAMLLCLVTRFPRMLLPLILLTGKELFAAVTGLLVIRKTGVVSSAAWHGKAATVSLYSLMAMHLLWFRIPAILSDIMILACCAVVLTSAVLYGTRNLRILFGWEKHHE